MKCMMTLPMEQHTFIQTIFLQKNLLRKMCREQYLLNELVTFFFIKVHKKENFNPVIFSQPKSSLDQLYKQQFCLEEYMRCYQLLPRATYPRGLVILTDR